MGRKYNGKEREIHNEAIKLRKMTDKQLIDYVTDSYMKGFNEGITYGHMETKKALSSVKGIGSKTALRISAALEEI